MGTHELISNLKFGLSMENREAYFFAYFDLRLTLWLTSLLCK